MKKYPVTYKGKEYEVRWEYGGREGLITHIYIYEVFTSAILKRKSYRYKYDVPRFMMDKIITLSKDNPNYYIEEAKTIFEIWERDEEDKQKAEMIKANKEKALEEWDGVIC